MNLFSPDKPKRSATLVMAVAALIYTAFSFNSTAAAEVSGDTLFSANGMPYELFGELPATRLQILDGVVDVAFLPGELSLSKAKIVEWINRSATAMANYYGQLPVARVRVLVIPVAGNSVHGRSFGYRGGAMKISLGRSASESTLARDWVMTHEMIHMSVPSLPDPYGWLEEGIATYVEPIARGQDGQLSAEKIWGDMIIGMPQGLPKAGDQGLNHTPSWGRTYWGGALFCLLAEVRIRQRTANRFGLQDALRAITAAGGNIETTTTPDYLFQVGDQATGVPVLAELYAAMKDQPAPVDLEALWQSLGVEIKAGQVLFNDDAPLAAIRRAITQPPAHKAKPTEPT